MPLPDDLSLPMPPPPNPSQREAALAAGVSRFEAHHGRAASPLTPAPEQPVKRWAGFARPQLAAFATVALVAMVSVPLWIERGPDLAQPAAPRSEAVAPAAETAAIAPSTDGAATDSAPASRVIEAPGAAVRPRFEPAPSAMSPPTESRFDSPQPLAAGPAQKAATDRLAVAVDGQAAAAPPPPPAPAQVARAAPALAGEVTNSIVVTGSRRAESADDAEPALRDSRDEARRRNAENAIVALDRKIDRAPTDAAAYLRRGEMWRRQGDLTRALADLDRAVRLAPRNARAYYQRSLVLRRLGQTIRAEADEQRAIDLDKSYDAIIP